MDYPVTSTEKTQSAAEKGNEKQQLLLKTPDTGIIMSPYIPYLIAGSFVAMTALLTLLLTIIMDNKAELDQVLDDQEYTSQTMLADAREAFGQNEILPASNTEAPSTPALLQKDVAVTPEPAHKDVDKTGTPTGNSQDEIAAASADLTTRQELPNEVSKENINPVINESESQVTHKLATNHNEENKKVIVQLEAISQENTKSPEPAKAAIEIAGIASEEQSQDEDKLAANDDSEIADSELLVEKDSRVTRQPITKQPASFDANLASSHKDLNKLTDIHENRIEEIRTAISLRPTNKQHIESMVNYHITLMDAQFRTIEKQIRETYPPMFTAFELFMNKRRESFNRSMQRRTDMLRQMHETHSRLRERYSQLLDLMQYETKGLV